MTEEKKNPWKIGALIALGLILLFGCIACVGGGLWLAKNANFKYTPNDTSQPADAPQAGSDCSNANVAIDSQIFTFGCETRIQLDENDHPNLKVYAPNGADLLVQALGETICVSADDFLWINGVHVADFAEKVILDEYVNYTIKVTDNTDGRGLSFWRGEHCDDAIASTNGNYVANPTYSPSANTPSGGNGNNSGNGGTGSSYGTITLCGQTYTVSSRVELFPADCPALFSGGTQATVTGLVCISPDDIAKADYSEGWWTIATFGQKNPMETGTYRLKIQNTGGPAAVSFWTCP